MVDTVEEKDTKKEKVINICERSSIGRALRCHRRGCRIVPGRSLKVALKWDYLFPSGRDILTDFNIHAGLADGYALDFQSSIGGFESRIPLQTTRK